MSLVNFPSLFHYTQLVWFLLWGVTSDYYQSYLQKSIEMFILLASVWPFFNQVCWQVCLLQAMNPHLECCQNKCHVFTPGGKKYSHSASLHVLTANALKLTPLYSDLPAIGKRCRINPKHIEARTKWLPFHRHFQVHFLEWKLWSVR